MTIDPTLHDLKTAPDAVARAVAGLRVLVDDEAGVNDPPTTVDERLRRWRSEPSFRQNLALVAWDAGGTRALGAATMQLWHVNWNRDFAFPNVAVRPETRGAGLGARLLDGLLVEAERLGRRRFVTSVSDRQAAGSAWLAALGGRPGLEEHKNRLLVERLDLDLMRSWVERARERAAGYEITLFEGPPPPGVAERMDELAEVMNTAPRGNLDLEDEAFTPEQLAEMDAQLDQRGLERFTAVVSREGNPAGYSVLFLDPANPGFAHQGDTGVHPNHRNLGLGRWLKAANLLRVLQVRPGVRVVDTYNADSNGPMLGINLEMGFRPHLAHTEWQFGLEGARAWLARRPVGGMEAAS